MSLNLHDIQNTNIKYRAINNYKYCYKSEVNIAKIMMLIDTHTHLDCGAFSHDYQDIIQRCLENNVNKMMLIGVRYRDWQHKLALVKNYPDILYPVIGLHPVFLKDHHKEQVKFLDEYLQKYPVTAVGEIGLDYFQKSPHITMPDKNEQQWYFEAQLELAEKYQKPVVLHVRKAHDEVLKTLHNFNIVSGIAHAFNGSIQHAEKYIEKGFCLGAGGMITHPHSNKLHKLFSNIPLDAIVLETDAPDLTVFQHKGERNSPEYLPYICDKLAELKNTSSKHIAQQTTLNAVRCLNINLPK